MGLTLRDSLGAAGKFSTEDALLIVYFSAFGEKPNMALYTMDTTQQTQHHPVPP